MPLSDPMPNLLWDITPKIVLVLILLYGSMLLLRRFSGARRLGVEGPRLALLNTMHLAPGRSVHLIGVGDKVLLVGATSQHVSLLTEMDAGMAASEPSAAASQIGFEDYLSQARGALQSASFRLKLGKGDNSRAVPPSGDDTAPGASDDPSDRTAGQSDSSANQVSFSTGNTPKDEITR